MSESSCAPADIWPIPVIISDHIWHLNYPIEISLIYSFYYLHRNAIQHNNTKNKTPSQMTTQFSIHFSQLRKSIPLSFVSIESSVCVNEGNWPFHLCVLSGTPQRVEWRPGGPAVQPVRIPVPGQRGGGSHHGGELQHPEVSVVQCCCVHGPMKSSFIFSRFTSIYSHIIKSKCNDYQWIWCKTTLFLIKQTQRHSTYFSVHSPTVRDPASTFWQDTIR